MPDIDPVTAYCLAHEIFVSKFITDEFEGPHMQTELLLYSYEALVF